MRIAGVTFLTVFGCGQDYDLNGKNDASEGTGTTTGTGPGTTTDFSDICEGLSGTALNVDENSECDVDLQTGTFTPVVKFHYGNNKSFCGPPGIGQIADTDGDGALTDADMPAIVFYDGGQSGTSNGKVTALKGDNSGVLWTTRQGVGQDGGFAIGDLDGDGWPEVVGVGTDKVVTMDGRDGSTKWQSQSLGSSLDPYGYNYPSILDMDGDGQPEVTVGNVILDGATGGIRGRGTRGIGAAPYFGDPSIQGSYGTLSVPYDLDNDGQAELVTGNAAYEVDGSIKWQNNGLDGLIAIADFDGDGEGEIVKTSGTYVTGMETDGTEVWGPIDYAPYRGAYVALGAPSIDDLDADGVPDIVFAAQNELVALDWGGRVKWTATMNDQSGAAGPVLFDFELDGYPEVLYADETGVRFYSGLDGSTKFASGEHASYTILETPVVADVDNDGHVEIVLGHCSWNKAFSVYGDANDSWPAGRKTWNQHGYAITNIGDLGTVPVGPSPNYFDYNSFRSGDVGQPPGEWLDLRAEIFDVCEKECDDGKVYLGAWVLNAGNIEAPAGVPVSIRAGTDGALLATQYTTIPVPPGTSGEPLIFEIDASALGDKRPFALADADSTGAGLVFECEEGNNTDDWDSSTCE